MVQNKLLYTKPKKCKNTCSCVKRITHTSILWTLFSTKTLLRYLFHCFKVNVTYIYVMGPGSGEDPELQNTPKNASYQGGRAAN